MKRLLLIAILLLVFAPAVIVAQDSPVPSPTPEPTLAPEPTSVPTATPEPPPGPKPLPDPPAPEDRTVKNILAWIGLGGCGFLAFFIIENLPGTWFHDRTPEVKQYIASGISGNLAVLAYVGLVALGVKDNPGETMAWLDVLLPVFFVGAGFANLTHSRFVLRLKSVG